MNAFPAPHRFLHTAQWLRLGTMAVICAGLVACGGAEPEETGSSKASEARALAEPVPAATQQNPGADARAELEQAQATSATDQLWLDLALLNAQELSQAVAPEGGEPLTEKSTTVQAKVITRTPVHRFFNGQTSAHFYTTSSVERDRVMATLPQFRYEGVAFDVSSTSSTGLSPVYRFFNAATGVHFYTISAGEKATIEANLPQFRYEGVAYYASQTPQAGMQPLYRFYLTSQGFHFFSSSEVERDRIRATLPQYRYEGVAYHVLSPVAPPPTEASCGLANFRTELLSRINQARQSARMCGSQSMPAVGAVVWNDQLMQASTGHAVDMATNNYFSHTSLDGRRFDQRITAAGYPWRAAGENIAAGYGSVASVMNGWLASDGHCRNIMGAGFTEVAVACASSTTSNYSTYWVMSLGAR
jgi:uncharacterized protein YkwD